MENLTYKEKKTVIIKFVLSILLLIIVAIIGILI